ncbi:MAG: peptidoglycan DD-metalloendopeptidase family protein [Rhizobiaceae bacterium]|nr:peptidoglycan DD-metalloendopeptidase family protein [Rhizobiaceae bacterium]
MRLTCKIWFIPRTLRGLFAAGIIVLSIAGVAAAQSSITDRQSTIEQLEAVTNSLNAAEQRQLALKKQIETLDRDVGAINRALIEGAKRGQELEKSISETEERLTVLLKSQNRLSSSLHGKRALLSEVLAALQRMGTNPPPALLVRPEDALASVRSAILLGSVVPEIGSQAKILLTELNALKEISASVEQEKENLNRGLNRLAEDETRLSVLVEEKQSLATQSRNELVSERARAIELGKKAVSLKDLISDLESQIASATAAAKAAKEADLRRQKRESDRLASTRKELEAGKVPSDQNGSLANVYNPSRIEPAIAFSQAQGTLLRPVSGQVLYGFGEEAFGQGKSSSVAMSTRPNARVRSPTDGWVVYAGPFRSYGQILILNAGEGYHMVLSGLAEVNVEAGRFVLAGEPVGRMGVIRFAAAIPLDLGSNKPVLTVELRKDGKSIDPAPWWAIRKGSQKQNRPKQGT